MAVVGGTTSAITGGKFANGAESGAFVHLFNAEQRGFIEGVKEFGRMFGRALKVVTFQDKIYDEIPYTRVGNDAVSVIQNAHPAAQASLGGWQQLLLQLLLLLWLMSMLLYKLCYILKLLLLQVSQ